MDIRDLDNYHNMELLRFTTAGSVDDGKSTLIGRLLYDSKSIFEDQLEAVERTSKLKGFEHVDLALLTDGLKAEREQGITIDVAYRYFATPKRKFIIADTPGHIQYTRNMVTGASTANLALILVDARKGILEQTNRHSFIASLLQIPHIIVCINKMDLVDYSQEVFDRTVSEYKKLSSRLDVKDVHFIPISALKGDNVVDKSEKMPWYQGSTLMYLLENIHISSDENHIDCRFPVQYVIRPQATEFHDFRGYAGRIASGVFKPGDTVKILPSGFTSRIKSILPLHALNITDTIEEAFSPMSVTMTLDTDVDISRGDMIVRENNNPTVSQDIDMMICWMSEKPMMANGKYAVKHTSKDARCIIKEIRYKVDINSLHRLENDKNIGMNDIARIQIRTTLPLFFDSYRKNRITGSIILIDEATNETVGAGMII
ncbi:MAG: sulfate adenylyltransferase subunit CysN [Bacteroidetes bacterium]|nr:sulfate adenylyltransferase subunit CysN [Bacteroidota bacterium]MBK8875882.1 sulfate adenylyltransferase subunit CysN [Bacteroidota bacterium]MBK9045506.1 sulfate adenylyltransferase subunit CysN [Bacteroidota bacterium]MBK9423764.1 sulfate adenylyltransferase subunit CysN [Bacteroidota bacterium]MBL0072655.1 sulfate adenylyltransferase subunit CysN [Bacteroidota bacterium]